MERMIQGNLQVSVARSSQSSNPLQLQVRDKIKVSAQISSSRGYQNFTPPVLERLQKNRKIHNRAYSKSTLLIQKISSGSNFSPFRQIAKFKQVLVRQIEKFFPSPDNPLTVSSQGAVIEALLLGDRGRMDDSVSRALQNAGIFHLFAISGAHIALISFLFFSFFRLIRIPTRSSYVILMIFLIVYALLVEGRPSILRATIMTLIFLLGKLIWRETDLLNTISISAFALLCINPFSLFNAGFQMTYLATLSIVIFYPKIIKYLPKWPLRVSEIFALSTASQLGVLPIVAKTFNRITFSSLILNFAALPLVALIMISSYIFLFFSFLSPVFANYLVHIVNFLINFLISISHLFDGFTFLSFRIPTPHTVTIIGYFIFLLSCVLFRNKKKLKRVAFAGFLVFFAVLILYPFPAKSKDLRVTFIDVGQGDSILVEFPGKKKLLIDGGGIFSDSFDIGEQVLSPFLWEKGIKTIDYLVLTHPHPDHLNGLVSVSRNFKVREFWESLSPTANKSYEELLQNLSQSTKHRRMFRGYSRNIEDSVIDILHPIERPIQSVSIDNEKSMVLRLSYGQTSFLFTGDIGEATERNMLENMISIKSDILKSPHHGSLSSSSEEFLNAVRPSVIVIQVGENNRFNFPHPIILQRYEDNGATLFRTDSHGAIEISSDGKEFKIRTA
ncbi:DNA internalization-related competence protein ComEC/Rec2, partial [Acidobacteriota bacterium]